MQQVNVVLPVLVGCPEYPVVREDRVGPAHRDPLEKRESPAKTDDRYVFNPEMFIQILYYIA